MSLRHNSWPGTDDIKPFESFARIQFHRHDNWTLDWRLYDFQYFVKAGVSGADSVKVPYLAFCIVFLILAVVFYFIRLPHVGEAKIKPGAGALQYPHVILGVIAIFMYVGGEVSIGSATIGIANTMVTAIWP